MAPPNTSETCRDAQHQSEEFVSNPKIRHLAIIARDTAAVARYYEKVFDMKVVHTSAGGENYFLSDGYLTLAILKHRLEATVPVGLNHFGFAVEDSDEIARRIKEFGLEEPKKRPADRPYAESRACDPEGNFFDISQHGFEMVETEADRSRQKERA
jgi:predicted enzyme related to lactoylglutathione lyase